MQDKRVGVCCEGQGGRELTETNDAHESLQRRKAAVKNVYWR